MRRASAVFERLGYAYPAWSGPAPAALYDIDLRFDAGLSLLAGDSGSGKSTLLRVLNGLVPHFYGGRIAGQATAAGMDVAATPTRVLARHVGFVASDPETGFVRGSVTREVAFGPENLARPRRRIAEDVAAALGALGAGALADRRLSTLSGGERQRVAIAAALAMGGEMLALDEPTSQLDDAGADALAAELAALAADGRADVVAEHRTDRLGHADRTVHLDRGRLAGGARPRAPALPPRLTGPGGCEAWSVTGVTAGASGHPVLAEVDASGATGEIVALTGANGSGKTTLLRTVAGLAEPLAGRVERRAGRIAYLPQDPGVLLHRRSVRAELEQTLRWTGERADPAELLGVLGLGELAERDPRDLSGGQRQRAALAAVLIGYPALVLFDEPTRGMDAAARAALARLLGRQADGGASVLLATHDRELAAQLADRVYELAGGALRTATVAGGPA